MSETSLFIRPFLEFIFPNASPDSLTLYHAYIRKVAHLTEYGLLAFLGSRAFYYSSRPTLSRYWFGAALAIVSMVSSIDEINQRFTPDRTGSIRDVAIDLMGGLIGATVFLSILWYCGKKFNRHKS